MPAAMKRDSAACEVAEKDTKRAKIAELPAEVEDDIMSFCNQLADDDFQVAGPPSNRQMLVAMLPSALSAAAGERHPYQETVLKLVGEVVEAEEQRLQGCVSTAEESVNSVVIERTNLEAIVERAEAALKDKSEEARTKENSFNMAVEVVEDSKIELQVSTQDWKKAEAAEQKVVSKKEGIVVQAYASLGSTDGGQGARDELFNQAPVQAAAKAHKRTPAQVLLRWALEKGCCVVPKSTKAHRMAENAGIFDFSLTKKEINAIDALNQNKRFAWKGLDPDSIA